MNLNNNKTEGEALIYGESINDLEKLKQYKISHGTFYTGPFATSRGNPDFGHIPVISKYFFLIIVVYYAIYKNYKYTIYALMIYLLGCVLNGIRFHYINTLSPGGDDHKFLVSTVHDNMIGAFLSFIAIIYILLSSINKK
jgi:hypothetical protein